MSDVKKNRIMNMDFVVKNGFDGVVVKNGGAVLLLVVVLLLAVGEDGYLEYQMAEVREKMVLVELLDLYVRLQWFAERMELNALMRLMLNV
ncbi:hypothetical protein C5167_008211 [Papaver somniferum]|uniref:Uncharacterized protein n=1 Tax=Papaver somniferum TaxID=3469 RepID=A0A4Y7JX16_PAPSO|nr:hypothetical protein C5167_008211 [Papaver somniferum]